MVNVSRAESLRDRARCPISGGRSRQNRESKTNMENSKKSADEVVLGEEQLETVVGGVTRVLLRPGALQDALVQRTVKVESLFGGALVTRLDRSYLINTVVAN